MALRQLWLPVHFLAHLLAGPLCAYSVRNIERVIIPSYVYESVYTSELEFSSFGDGGNLAPTSLRRSPNAEELPRCSGDRSVEMPNIVPASSIGSPQIFPLEEDVCLPAPSQKRLGLCVRGKEGFR